VTWRDSLGEQFASEPASRLVPVGPVPALRARTLPATIDSATQRSMGSMPPSATPVNLAPFHWPGSESAGRARQRQSQRRPAVTLVSRSGHGRSKRMAACRQRRGREESNVGALKAKRKYARRGRRSAPGKVLQCDCGFDGHAGDGEGPSGGSSGTRGRHIASRCRTTRPSCSCLVRSWAEPADCDCSHNKSSKAKGEA
jgi:hypothetical protein